MPERVKWRIAFLLDKLPGRCWSRLVDWVYGDEWRWPTRKRTEQTEVCRADLARRGACYCGKLRRSGGGGTDA